jgi:hypothetical protein
MITQYCSGDQIEKRWAVHVARLGKMTSVYKLLVEKPEGKDHFEDPGVDRRILRWILIS